MGASSLIVLMIAAVSFSGIAILISKFVLKATTNKQKGEPYECGIPTQGPSWIQFNVGYYLFDFRCRTYFFIPMGRGGKTSWLDSFGRDRGFLFYSFHGTFICT